jgi:SH3-like domain-containing protein
MTGSCTAAVSGGKHAETETLETSGQCLTEGHRHDKVMDCLVARDWRRTGNVHEPKTRGDGAGRCNLAVALSAAAIAWGLVHGPAWAGTAAPPPVPTQATMGKSESGLPLPRFVSLKADRVNLRAGPGTDYPTSWVYRRAGLPLEVLSEFEGWRQVRDAEGATGWVLQSLLSGRRTALVTPWDAKDNAPAPQLPVRRSDSESARIVVNVEAGVIANVHSCDGLWCHVSIDKFRGYLPQKKLWGVYENEIVK